MASQDREAMARRNDRLVAAADLGAKLAAKMAVDRLRRPTWEYIPSKKTLGRNQKEPTKETIIRLRDEGYSWDAIGKEYGVVGPTVRNKAIRLGVPLKPSSGAFTLPSASDMDAPIRETDYGSINTEACVRDKIARRLREKGYTTRTELRSGRGRVDILAQKGRSTLLVEVKLGNVTQCAQAIGQVLFYAEGFPSACPVVAVPSEATQDGYFVSMCKRLGVEVWAIEEVLSHVS